MHVGCWPPTWVTGVNDFKHQTSAVDAIVAPSLTSPPFVSCFVIVTLLTRPCQCVGSNNGASEIRQDSWPILNGKLRCDAPTHATSLPGFALKLAV